MRTGLLNFKSQQNVFLFNFKLNIIRINDYLLKFFEKKIGNEKWQGRKIRSNFIQ